MGLVKLLRSSVNRFLKRQQIPKYTDTLDEVFGEHAIGEFPSDRTMSFYLNWLKAFTPEWIELLQDEVLTVYPYWRLYAQYVTTIGIYPSGAWLGEHWLEKGFDHTHPHYQEWVKRARIEEEKRYGPLRRQLTYLNRLLPGAIKRFSQRGYLHLATFDRYPPHARYSALWMLQKEYPNDHMLKIKYSSVAHYPVDVNGAIHPNYNQNFYPATSKCPAYWLVTYLIKPSIPMTYYMEDFETRKTIGPVHVKHVIKDAELKNAGIK